MTEAINEATNQNSSVSSMKVSCCALDIIFIIFGNEVGGRNRWSGRGWGQRERVQVVRAARIQNEGWRSEAGRWSGKSLK